MSSKANRMNKQVCNFNREYISKVIVDLYRIIQSQPLHKRIAFAFRVVFKRLPK